MHFELMYPSKYLKAVDLAGRDVTLTIYKIAVEEVKSERGSDMRPIVYFEEVAEKSKREKTEEKTLLMNKTNATTIAAMYGAETDDWIGQRITIFPTTCSMKGKTVECVRVRPRVPAASKGSKKAGANGHAQPEMASVGADSREPGSEG